jgi:hypothetical protein
VLLKRCEAGALAALAPGTFPATMTSRGFLPNPPKRYIPGFTDPVIKI